MREDIFQPNLTKRSKISFSCEFNEIMTVFFMYASCLVCKNWLLIQTK